MTRESNVFDSGKRRSEEVIVGACQDSDNPDLWFPDLGRGGDSRTDTRLVKKGKEINLALAICKSCDKKVECLEEGMRPENIYYGIWGGKLAGERLMSIGVKTGDYHPFSEPGMALNLYSRIEPYLRR